MTSPYICPHIFAFSHSALIFGIFKVKTINLFLWRKLAHAMKLLTVWGEFSYCSKSKRHRHLLTWTDQQILENSDLKQGTSARAASTTISRGVHNLSEFFLSAQTAFFSIQPPVFTSSIITLQKLYNIILEEPAGGEAARTEILLWFPSLWRRRRRWQKTKNG